MKSIVLVVSFLVGCIVTTTVRQNSLVGDSGDRTPLSLSQIERNMVDVEESPYGETSSGEKVTLFTLTNANGICLKMIDYGATVVSLETPDRDGKLANIVLTCDGITGFENCTMYFNGTVGRYCNRIANAKFSIDGVEYQLNANNAPHHLHGGNKGFDKRMWKAKSSVNGGDASIEFSLTSDDGDEAYPGTVQAKVTYTLTQSNELVIEYRATTDKATHVNLTNHNYWNLAGSGTILKHDLKLNSSQYIPVDATGIPLGPLEDTAGTPFDFADFQPIGSRFDQLKSDPIGYDHCYVIAGKAGEMRLAATVKDPSSGRMMEIRTTEPGIQFYSGNFLDGEVGSAGYAQNSAFCLETQHYPDSPNRSDYPSTLLKPGENYYHKTVHRFSVVE